MKAEHIEEGLVRKRVPRQNHKAVDALLGIPYYADPLCDQFDEDESERGRMLVQSAEGWRTELARWIGECREAEKIAEEVELASPPAVSDSEVAETESTTTRLRPPRKWKPITLEKLFGTLKKGAGESRRVRMSRRAMELEETYMMVMAELEAEDDTLDDGAVEVDDSEVYGE
jgi:hypothetical protein